MRSATLGRRIMLVLQGAALVLGMASAGMAGAAMLTGAAEAGTPAPACTTPSGGTTGNPIASGALCSKGGSQKSTLFGTGGIFTVIANTLIFIVGAVSVIYIIIGGLRYVTSGGDSKQVTQAKDTLLYAIIGVVVAMISFALVNFVITALNTAK